MLGYRIWQGIHRYRCTSVILVHRTRMYGSGKLSLRGFGNKIAITHAKVSHLDSLGIFGPHAACFLGGCKGSRWETFPALPKDKFLVIQKLTYCNVPELGTLETLSNSNWLLRKWQRFKTSRTPESWCLHVSVKLEVDETTLQNHDGKPRSLKWLSIFWMLK